MFDKSQKSYTDLLGKTNRIVEGTSIKGDITSQADLRIDGNIEGNITTQGRLVIGPAAGVTGDVKCKSADIEGKFNGRIEVAELLSIKNKASIQGEVIAGKLAVEPGAVFTATCTMKNTVKSITASNDKQQQAG